MTLSLRKTRHFQELIFRQHRSLMRLEVFLHGVQTDTLGRRLFAPVPILAAIHYVSSTDDYEESVLKVEPQCPFEPTSLDGCVSLICFDYCSLIFKGRR